MTDSLLNAHLFFMISHDLISLTVLGAGAYMLHRCLPKQNAQPSGETGVFRTVKGPDGKVRLEPVTDAESSGQSINEALDEWLLKSAS